VLVAFHAIFNPGLHGTKTVARLKNIIGLKTRTKKAAAKIFGTKISKLNQER
jgi:hypothetical protein